MLLAHNGRPVSDFSACETVTFNRIFKACPEMTMHPSFKGETEILAPCCCARMAPCASEREPNSSGNIGIMMDHAAAAGGSAVKWVVAAAALSIRVAGIEWWRSTAARCVFNAAMWLFLQSTVSVSHQRSATHTVAASHCCSSCFSSSASATSLFSM